MAVIRSEDITPKEVFIAVMGMTGSGKSTFIKTLTRNSSVVISDGLEACMSLLSLILIGNHSDSVRHG